MRDEGSRVLPIVTEAGLHRSMNFGVAPVQRAVASASSVCREGYQSFWIPSQDKVACSTTHGS